MNLNAETVVDYEGLTAGDAVKIRGERGQSCNHVFWQLLYEHKIRTA